MENYFLEKFKRKTKNELQRIVDNQEQYQPAAVSAAIHLLNEKQDEQLPLPTNTIEGKQNAEESNFGALSLSFDFTPFFRSLSYREFVTCIALALLFQAFFEIVDYYSNERLFENTQKIIKIALMILVFLANHVYYRLEHRRSNNFIGRSINDLFLVIILILTRVVYQFILDSSYRVTFDGNGVEFFILIFGIMIFIFAFEFSVALLKFLLKPIKCQIF